MTTRNRGRPAPEIRTAEAERILAATPRQPGAEADMAEMPTAAMDSGEGEASAAPHYGSHTSMPVESPAGAAPAPPVIAGFGGEGRMPEGRMDEGGDPSAMGASSGDVHGAGANGNGNGAGALVAGHLDVGTAVIDMPTGAMDGDGSTGTGPGEPGGPPGAAGGEMPDAATEPDSSGQAIELAGTWKLTLSIGGAG